jgi:hypothetical protein
MKTNILMRSATITALLVVSSSAQAWWKCPGGYSMQSRNGGSEVRCFKPASTQSASLNTNCPQVQTPLGPVGAGFSQDYYPGGADACVTKDPTGTAKTAVPHQFCPSGYTQIKKSGRDECQKTTPAAETMPNVNS